ncbi:MAG: DUF167 domain-containing protein [Patescibacteria group bacterium]
MKIFVKVKSNAKEEKVEKISETNFMVAVKEPPIKGKANKAVIKALAEFLGITPSQFVLKSGATSRQKIFEIML